MSDQLKGYGPSIHFGMVDNEYYSDPALSYSGMKQILDEPLEYWLASSMNPERKFVETPAMKKGKWFHCLLLEPEQFNKRYYVMPVEQRQPNKTMVKLSEFNEAKDAIKVLRDMENFSLFFERGYPEVAIFWRDPSTGIMLRSKHDYFSPFYTTDYKTTDTLFAPYLKGKIKRYGYNIQAAVYLEARMQIREALKKDEAVIYGDVDPSFLKSFLNSEFDSFGFVFQKTTPPFAAQINVLNEYYIDMGQKLARKAIMTYVKYMEKYGNKRWPVSDGKIRELSPFEDDTDF